MTDLIPRAPKRKRQPTAECMRQQLALAADEIIRLRSQLAQTRRSIHAPMGPVARALLQYSGNRPWHPTPPPPPTPPPNRDVNGRNYQRPWWRRIFRSKAA